MADKKKERSDEERNFSHRVDRKLIIENFFLRIPFYISITKIHYLTAYSVT